LQHVSEAWKVADEIAKAKVPSSIIMIDSPGGKLETMDVSYDERRGARKSGRAGRLSHRRLHYRFAPFSALGGVSGARRNVREKALYGMTMANAVMLELQDRVGSLEAGKDADFIVLSGDPLSVYTHVRTNLGRRQKRFRPHAIRKII
jgi:cytosine/adenosine deaminase-related metal-dependent hydrolase